MTDQQHHVVFKGQLIEGVSADVVKQKLAALFKISVTQAEAMLTGKPVYIKKNVDVNTAKKYQAAMQKAGAVANIVSANETSPAANANASSSASTTTAAVKNSSSSANVKLPGDSASSEIPNTTAPQTSVALNTNADISGLSMAATGSDLQTSVPETQKANVDVSGISMAEPGAAIISEPVDIPAINIDTGELSLEETFT